MTTVADVVALLDSWFNPAWAEPWDAVGLTVGSLDAPAGQILVAVDPTLSVAREAVATGADLLVTHHPLWLGGTTSVARGAQGQVASELTGRSLFVAHTNADVALPGVSDALATRLGLSDLTPVQPTDERLDRWVVHVPRSHTAAVFEAMTAAGAGSVGAYDRCAFVVAGEGTFRPLVGSHPFVGVVGHTQRTAEDRLEMVALPSLRRAVGNAVRAAHPYEVPSVTLTEVLASSGRGLGRVGALRHPMTLAAFCELVADRLPATASGVRATGDPGTMIASVAVAGGACADLAAAAAAAGADVLVTSDAKHHRALEAPLPLVEVAHWAGEWPWAAALADRLAAVLPACRITVSTQVTDPWTVHRAGRAGSAR